jgi:hypothetical protein
MVQAKEWQDARVFGRVRQVVPEKPSLDRFY